MLKSVLDHVRSAFGRGTVAEARSSPSDALDAQRLLGEARTFVAAGNKNHARTVLHQQLMNQCGDPESLLECGRLLELIGDRDGAGTSYQKGLRTDPTHFGLVFQLALLRLYEGRLDESRELLETAGELRPDAGEVAFYSGQIDYLEGDSGSAVEQLERAMKLEPGYSRHEDSRIVEVTVCDTRAWCDADGDGCTVVAESRVTDIGDLNVLPATPLHMDPRAEATPEAFLCRIRAARVLPNPFAVMTDNHRLLLEGVVHNPRGFVHKKQTVKYLGREGRVLIEQPEKEVIIDEPCILLGGRHENFNYYHWLAENLGRLYIVSQSPELRGLPFLVNDNLNSVQLDTLMMMGVHESELLRQPADTVFGCEELYLPSATTRMNYMLPGAMEFIRHRLLEHSGCRACDKRRRVYISRQNCRWRRLANEQEILPLLEDAGFEIVYPENLDVKAQIRLFSETQVLLSVTGAANINMLFMPERARVGIIAPRDYVYPMFHFIGRQLGQEVTYLLAQRTLGSELTGDICDVTVSPKTIQSFIDRLD